MYYRYIRLFQGITTVLGCFVTVSVRAQISPDDSLPENSVTTPQGDVIQIDGGTTKGNNLFHSFTDFSVPAETQANFNNADTIENILSRVTGGRESIIEGGISANGTANVFLINPAGIIFSENSSLDIGGSFVGSTADSLIFPDEIEYSATNPDNSPVLTINAPIGLGFRDNPGNIVNRSIVTDDIGTPDNFDDDDLIGLRVFEDRTLALIGGEILIEGGFLSTIGGRIELGSVVDNSTVSITPVTKGFDFGYKEASGFQDITLSFASVVNNLDANTGDIDLQGKNINLIEGSAIGTDTQFEGQAGNINIIASESLKLDGNSAEVGLGNFETQIFSDLADDATGEGSSININTPILNITNGAFIASTNDFGNGRGVDINITATEIDVAESFLDDSGNPITSGIFSNVFEQGTGNGGDIKIDTDKLNLDRGAQINTITSGTGNAGNLTIDASKSIALSGTVFNSNIPSGLFANVEIPLFTIPTAGNAGNITINTPKLSVTDGAQIATTALNDGNGGILTINASESILLSGSSSLAEYRGEGISGIFVSVRPSYENEETETIVSTTGNGGRLNLTTKDLTIEKGASVAADTFSLGRGGNINIDTKVLSIRDGSEIRAGSFLGVDPLDNQRGTGGTIDIKTLDSIEIVGTGDINGTLVNSSILTLAESDGDAGNISLTTTNLNITNRGEINASAVGTGAAGNIKIDSDAIDLINSSIIASTNSGEGGNIALKIADNLILKDTGFISARALQDANGGNINIDTDSIVAFPNGNNDIIATAQRGNGGNININAESLFGIQQRPLSNSSNDINASSEFSLNGTITINTPDLNSVRGEINLPDNIIKTEETTARVCTTNRKVEAQNHFAISGKGGILDDPGSTQDSHNILINGKSNINSAIPQAIATHRGDIQPARGIKLTKSGDIILTGYRTNNAGDRIPQSSRNCG